MNPLARIVPATGTSVSISVMVAWIWNMIYPDNRMPAEVAAAVGGLIGPVIEEMRAARRALFERWMQNNALKSEKRDA